jgi:hypothetical protein
MGYNFAFRPIAQFGPDPAQKRPPKHPELCPPPVRQLSPEGRAWPPCTRAPPPWMTRVLFSAACLRLARLGGAPERPARVPPFSPLASPSRSLYLRTRARSAAAPLPSRTELRGQSPPSTLLSNRTTAPPSSPRAAHDAPLLLASPPL